MPETVGRYRIRRELGRGMMGVVYLANDPDLGRDIALKVIQLPPGANDTERASFELRFFSEAQSAARLSHPGIVIVHDVGRDSGTGALFMALQLLPGRTLDALLRERKRLEWPEALRLTRRLAEALEHAHSEGVVHRDIKPSNIMILPTGEPKIMDFGIAKVEAGRLTATGQFIGTPLYMSPEQAQAHPVDGRSDIFSLGSVLYEMLTGAPAFEGETVTRILYRLMSAEPEPPSVRLPGLPQTVDNILRRCLMKDVSLRYPNAQALADDITAIIGPGDDRPRTSASVSGSGTVGASPPEDAWMSLETRALTAPKPRMSRRALGAALGVLAASVLGLLAWRSREPEPVARRITPVPTPTPSSSPAETPGSEAKPLPPPPGQRAVMTLVFEHSLKGGVLRIAVDGLRVVERPFGSRVTRRIAGIERRKGEVTETLEVSPGLREVAVEVLWDDNRKSEASQTFFNPGSRLRLKAKLGGIRKNLSLEWN
jgi:serine/threonine-protein kinase